MDQEELATTFINKIPDSDTSRNFIFKSRWQPDYLRLYILNSHQSKEWTGRITNDELQKSAEELEIPFEQFIGECKAALTTNGGLDPFQYKLDEDKFILVKNENFQIQYLEIDLRRTSDLQGSVAESAADLIATLRSQLESAQQESKKLNQKYHEIVTTLNRCLDEKNQIERKLLRKFSVLLNTKKDKIAEMQDLLLEKNKKLEATGMNRASSSKRKSTEMVGDSIDADGDDFLQDTQPLTQPVLNLPKRKKLPTPDSPATGNNSLNRGAPINRPREGVNTESIEDIFDQL